MQYMYHDVSCIYIYILTISISYHIFQYLSISYNTSLNTNSYTERMIWTLDPLDPLDPLDATKDPLP